MGGSNCPSSSSPPFSVFSCSLKNFFSSSISFSNLSLSSISFFLMSSFSFFTFSKLSKFNSFSSISILSFISSTLVFFILYFFFISSIALFLSYSLLILSPLSSSIFDKSGNFIPILFILFNPCPSIRLTPCTSIPLKSFSISLPVRSLFECAGANPLSFLFLLV